MTLLAYIGPGAGFAAGGPILLVLVAVLSALAALAALPVRAALQAVRQRRRGARARVRQVVILGLDGFDAGRTLQRLEAGELPNLARLRAAGTFMPLATTTPPLSPVAWSTFATGVNPGKHRVFDFVRRDPASYRLESALTQWRTHASGPSVSLRRAGKPFWHILGKADIPVSVHRVPGTFPPEPFEGRCLAGMGVPDLRGTQGEYTLFSSEAAAAAPSHGHGRAARLVRNGAVWEGVLEGPAIGGEIAALPFRVRQLDSDTQLEVSIGRARHKLSVGVWSPWIRLPFRKGLRKVSGLCRVLVLATEPQPQIYVSPLNIDPLRPAMPLSCPDFYAPYLARLQGDYGTLGMGEDTWGLVDGVLSDQAFMEQAWALHEEREQLFMEALDMQREGLLVAVFELADRVQHVFAPDDEAAVGAAYRRLDETVGRVMAAVDKQALVLVVSDHGFAPFERAVSLNAWLREAGYLQVNAEGRVDWRTTRAYGVGLTGIFLNIKGREAQGCVAPSDAAGLRKQIAHEMAQLRDTASGKSVIRIVHEGGTLYQGPYVDEAPDLVVGFEPGYRITWDSAEGGATGPVFIDNPHRWRWDHAMASEAVPGIFFSSHPVSETVDSLHLADIAPTVVDVFGLPIPSQMDGRRIEVVFP